MGARFYDPNTGRFISPDTIVPEPLNPQSLNHYSYAVDHDCGDVVTVDDLSFYVR
jgi:RHS repeat-associated protein